MKTKILLAGFLIAIFAAAGTAQTNTTDLELQKYNLSEYESTVNQHTDELPGWIKDMVGGEDINIYIDEGQEDAYNISIRMEGLKVQNITDSSLDNPDLEVWTSTDVIEKIIEAEDPVQEMKDAINNEEIEYQANGAWNKVKIFFANMFFKFI